MSNDKAIVRVFKLWAKVSMMVVDGKRDATSVADMLQVILNQSQTPTFDPSAFIDTGWSYDEARDPRSAALGLLGDYSQVKLTSSWLQRESIIDGEIRRSRILDLSSVPLNCDHFLDLWNNKEKIPEEWKNVEMITFDGDILLDSRGRRCILCLRWRNGEWHWLHEWLVSVFDTNCPSLVLAN